MTSSREPTAPPITEKGQVVAGRPSMWALLNTAIADWSADRIPQAAAGLAYYTVFSIAPLLLITIGIAGLVMGEDQARAGILAQVDGILGAQGRGAIEGLMGQTGEAQRSGLISTIVGVLTLLVGAVGVLAHLRSTLNVVWNVDESGSSWGDFARAYIANFGLVLATGFLLLVSLVATTVLTAVTSSMRGRFAGADGLWFAVDAVVGVAAATLVFALIFKMVPKADVQWRDVWTGAIFTAVLFSLGRVALGWYLGREGGDSAYAAAGSLLVLLAWVYYSSQLVLFGAEFTHAYAEAYGSRRIGGVGLETP